MKLIESKTLGSAQASIEFTSIPQTYTDLVLLFTFRSNSTDDPNEDQSIRFNGSSSNYSYRVLFGNGSSAGSFSGTSKIWLGARGSNSTTSNTFTNNLVYIPNYTASTNKSVSADSVSENNGTNANQSIVAGLWSDSAAITSISIFAGSGQNLLAGCSASLYGVLKGSDGIVTTSP